MFFKEYGIANRLPKSTMEELLKETELEGCLYISFVEDDAFTEVINHNKDVNDLTRGTNILSLKLFFSMFFGEDEYKKFKEYSNLFSKKVRDFFGFSLVRTLKPNTMNNFRMIARVFLQKMDLSSIIDSNRVTQPQQQLMDKNFFDDKNYEVLLGTGDFAETFLTAEWLYSSLENTGNIDLTSIAMGYFKSIEQLLFGFIKLHTHEKDGQTRKIFVGKGKSYADIQGNAILTDEIMNNPEKSKNIVLGSLSGFFGFHFPGGSRYDRRNQDLLVNGINTQTHEYIIDVFNGTVELRNGYFHRDNLHDWRNVNKARNAACLVFYLLLGAFNLSVSDKTLLGLIPVDDHDDYYKLCEYINQKSFEAMVDQDTYFSTPIFYINNINDPYDFVLAHQDIDINYDSYGEPLYSAAYFRHLDKKMGGFKITRNDLPKEIWEGELMISKSTPTDIKPSGAKNKIFSDGKFIQDKK